MTDSVRVEGADEVARTFGIAADSLGDMGDVNAQIAEVIASASRSLAPRLTGALANSLMGQADKAEAVAGSDIVYAGAVIGGWPAHNIEAHPVLVKAVTQTAPVWMKLLFDDIQKDCHKVRGA